MQRYGNRGGNSGIVAYEIEPDAIVVQFQGGATYRYSKERLGDIHIERMKRLAAQGRGLAGYISKYVGAGYDEKLS